MFKQPKQVGILSSEGFSGNGLTGGWSGTSNLSNEELARSEIFYHVKRSGGLTYMGKQPDIRTNEGVVLAFNKIQGDVRVVNNYLPGVSDTEAITRYTSVLRTALSTEDRLKLAEHLSKSVVASIGEAAASTGVSVSKSIIRGSRKMFHL